MLISIVVNNFNYEKFVRCAIDSALAQTYRPIEVIVVDDGSTDSSVSVIESYGDQITAIIKPNGGQGSAYNAGFEKCKGEWILFLDADDALRPDACEKVAGKCAGDISKVHFPLSIVDADLHPFGLRMPELKILEGDVRTSLLTYGAYGSPPGSGNLYRREFLAQVLPMPETEWRICADAFLILQAPFYGSIGAVDEELGLYRQHRKSANADENNTSALAGNAYGLAKLLALLNQEDRLLATVARSMGIESASARHKRNPAYMKNLLCALLIGEAPQGSPSKASVALSGFQSCLAFPLYSARKRIMGSLWFLVAGFAPRQTALRCVRYALDPTARVKARASSPQSP